MILVIQQYFLSLTLRTKLLGAFQPLLHGGQCHQDLMLGPTRYFRVSAHTCGMRLEFIFQVYLQQDKRTHLVSPSSNSMRSPNVEGTMGVAVVPALLLSV